VLAAAPSLATDATDTETAAAGRNELSEIVVTAEKRTSTVQETPISMTALTGDALAQQGIVDLQGIVHDVPGISMRTAGPGQTELEMRGLSSSGGSSATVGYYLDDYPLTPPAAALNGKVVLDPDLFDLNRVEVLRGPQGTLYGAGSMGGTMKLVTNAPNLKEFQGEVQGTGSGTSGGGFNHTGNLMLNVPLIADSVALRLVGTDKYVDGWINRIVEDGAFPVPRRAGVSRLDGLHARERGRGDSDRGGAAGELGAPAGRPRGAARATQRCAQDRCARNVSADQNGGLRRVRSAARRSRRAFSAVQPVRAFS
jgi:outer membrane receptor protein involved in Fe transport